MSAHTVAELVATYHGDLLVQAALAHLTRLHCGDDRPQFASPTAAGEFACVQLAGCTSEKFCAAWLDNRHRLIAWEQLFTGTIGGAEVHPREVVRSALQHNAAAVIVAHNHPSGNPEPSQADKDITTRLAKAFGLIEVRLLDHFVVGGGRFVSLAERGWL